MIKKKNHLTFTKSSGEFQIQSDLRFDKRACKEIFDYSRNKQ